MVLPCIINYSLIVKHLGCFPLSSSSVQTYLIFEGGELKVALPAIFGRGTYDNEYQ